jgi:hypothetical protein
VPCEQQHGQHVVAIGEVVAAAAVGDDLGDDLVDGVDDAREDPPAVRALGTVGHQLDNFTRSGGRREEVAEALAQRGQARVALVDAEDDPHDHLERDGLHVRVDLERLAHRPGGDLALGDLAHQPDVRAHLLAVERRQQQAALAQVRRVVEQQDRLLPQEGQQDDVALAGVEDGGVSGEDCLDVGRVGERDERLTADVHGERVAVARASALDERQRAEHPRERLQGARRARAGRQPAARGHLRQGGSGGGGHQILESIRVPRGTQQLQHEGSDPLRCATQRV